MDTDGIHYYEPSQGHRLKQNPFTAIVAPRPIGWISSLSAEGQLNLAPYSMFNTFAYEPPVIGFSSIERKDSVKNASETGEFVWNLVTKELGAQMNKTAEPVPRGVSEFDIVGLTAAVSHVKAPRVLESRAAMECKVTQIIELNNSKGEKIDGWLVLGEVVAVHIDKSLIKDGIYQTALANPILRPRGDYLEVTQDRMFEMEKPAGMNERMFR